VLFAPLCKEQRRLGRGHRDTERGRLVAPSHWEERPHSRAEKEGRAITPPGREAAERRRAGNGGRASLADTRGGEAARHLPHYHAGKRGGWQIRRAWKAGGCAAVQSEEDRPPTTVG